MADGDTGILVKYKVDDMAPKKHEETAVLHKTQWIIDPVPPLDTPPATQMNNDWQETSRRSFRTLGTALRRFS